MAFAGAVAVASAVACMGHDAIAPDGPRMVRSRIDGQPLNAAKLAHIRRYANGCLVSVHQRDGGRWAVAARGDQLPFALGPLAGPRRRAHVVIPIAGAGTRINVDCTVAAALSDADFVTAINASYQDAKWKPLWHRLVSAPRDSRLTPRTRSLESREVRAEVFGLSTLAAASGDLATPAAGVTARVRAELYDLPPMRTVAEPYKPPAPEPGPWLPDPEYEFTPDRSPQDEYDEFDRGGEDHDAGGGEDGDTPPPPTPTTTDSSQSCDQQDPRCPKKLDSTQQKMLDSAIKLIKLSPTADSACRRALDTLTAMFASGRVFAGAAGLPENLNPTDTSKHDAEHGIAFDTVSAWSVMHLDADLFSGVTAGTKTWRGFAQVTLHEAMHAMMDRTDPENPVMYRHTGESGPDYATYPFNLTNFNLAAGQGCVP